MAHPNQPEVGDRQRALLAVVALCVLNRVDRVNLHFARAHVEVRRVRVKSDVAVVPDAVLLLLGLHGRCRGESC